MSILKEKIWDGRIVEVVKSNGSGVVAFLDYKDNVLYGNPEDDCLNSSLIKKVCTNDNRMLRHFKPGVRDILKKEIGHYSYLQSNNSEDAVTWSVFGTLQDSSNNTLSGSSIQWFEKIMKKIFNDFPKTGKGKLELWSKDPNTRAEPDWIFSSDKAVVVCEAKWKNDIGDKQGPNKDKDQLYFRICRAKTEAKGKKMYVLVVALPPEYMRSSKVLKRYFEYNQKEQGYTLKQPKEIKLEAVTWGEILGNIDGHPLERQVKNYLNWKLDRLNKEIKTRKKG